MRKGFKLWYRCIVYFHILTDFWEYLYNFCCCILSIFGTFLKPRAILKSIIMTAEIFVFVLLLCSDPAKTASVDKSFKFSRYDEIENISSSVSTACQLRIHQSSHKKILKLIHHQKKNAIELNVFIESSNDTLNRTRLLKGITWANKMGRTLVSLIAQAENFPSMILSSYTATFAAVKIVDIVIYEEGKDCLSLSSKNTSDIVFSFLLHQLYLHSNANDPEYELCVRNTDSGIPAFYNCCSLLGAKRISICSGYSSTVLVSFTGLIVGGIFFFIYYGFPLTVELLDNEKKERLEFKVSDSPMSLSSIFLYNIYWRLWSCKVVWEEIGCCSNDVCDSLTRMGSWLSMGSQFGGFVGNTFCIY